MNNNRKNRAQTEQYPQKSSLGVFKNQHQKNVEIDAGLRRWEIAADQRRYGSKVGDWHRRYTDRLLSYLGLGLCRESDRAMVTEGEENAMKRVEGGG